MSRLRFAILLPGLVILSACTTFHDGPSKAAYPGSQMSFEQFQIDDQQCQDYAYDYTGMSQANQRAEEKTITGSVLGTLIGGLIGAAANGKKGAAVGAGAGLILGTAIGSDNAEESAGRAQRNYDSAYLQCMYAKGHRVPSNHRDNAYPQPTVTTHVTPPPVSHTTVIYTGQTARPRPPQSNHVTARPPQRPDIVVRPPARPQENRPPPQHRPPSVRPDFRPEARPPARPQENRPMNKQDHPRMSVQNKESGRKRPDISRESHTVLDRQNRKQL